MGDGASLFDDDRLFESYKSGRHQPASPNESLEAPVFRQLIGDVTGKRVLDLGCGDAGFGLELMAGGCTSYVGLESSQNMALLAEETLRDMAGEVVHTRLEDWDYPPAQFDLVVSRLVLHYVADLPATFGQVNTTLKPGGQFVFSMMHPVITSCDRSREGGGRREDWIVDDYFKRGPRTVYTMDKRVRQYHRTVEDIFRALQGANFSVEHLRESDPQPQHFDDDALYERRRRIPLFIFFSSKKPGML